MLVIVGGPSTALASIGASLEASTVYYSRGDSHLHYPDIELVILAVGKILTIDPCAVVLSLKLLPGFRDGYRVDGVVAGGEGKPGAMTDKGPLGLFPVYVMGFGIDQQIQFVDIDASRSRNSAWE